MFNTSKTSRIVSLTSCDTVTLTLRRVDQNQFYIVRKINQTRILEILRVNQLLIFLKYAFD
jgi:hypothetical protein